MRILLIYFVLMHLGIYSQQNLIYNGDFEIYDTCPSSISTPGDLQIEKCTGWYVPTMATPDYFNTCANWPVSVPLNTFGNRTPQNGNGYIGQLIEYCYNSNGICTNGWWIEYVQSELLQELMTGYEYEFSCYISLTNNLFAQFAYSSFGALFTSNDVSRNDSKPFELIPQVLNSSTNFLTDTNWVRINKKLIANGNEKYITIGFYIDTTNLDTLLRPDNVDEVANWFYSSYYYIDNCTLIETGNIYSAPNIFTPNGDGINDNWSPFSIELNETYNIYNRWGNIVWEINSIDKYWFGYTKQGNKCSDGIYYYISTKGKSGYITLINNQ